MIVNNFMTFPVWCRAAIVLFICLVLVWMLLRKVVLFILSIIPFLIEWFYRKIYILIELPIATLHKMYGGYFYKIDNCLSRGGEKLDFLLNHWYAQWHSPKKYKFGLNLLFYSMCVVFVATPTFLHTDNEFWGIGEKLYIYGESSLVKLASRQEWHDFVQNITAKVQQPAEEASAGESFEITLVVSGVDSSLLVRDIPSFKGYMALEHLKNGDIVIWRGEVQFAEAENDHVEPWVKVITENGVEGWSRLYFLHPEEYKGVNFLIKNADQLEAFLIGQDAVAVSVLY